LKRVIAELTSLPAIESWVSAGTLWRACCWNYSTQLVSSEWSVSVKLTAL